MNVSSSSYISSSSSSNGFSGLASGIDTEALVEAMLSGTQSNIDKASGEQQQLLWQQEMYRDIITKINTFQNTYFSSSSSTNLASASFYDVMNAVTKSDNFKITATTAAAVGNIMMRVDQLATNSNITSGSAVSGKLDGAINTTKLQNLVDEQLGGTRNVVFTSGDTEIAVDLTDIFVSGGQFTTSTDEEKTAEIESRINTAFADAGVDATATIEKGNLVIETANASTHISVSADSDELGLQTLGLSAGDDGRLQNDVMILESGIDLSSEISFEIALDDSSKEISIDMTKIMSDSDPTQVDVAKFAAAFEEQVDKAHGTGQIDVSIGSDNSISISVGYGRKVMIGGDEEVLDILGYKNGQSNKIGMGGELRDLYFSEALQGSKYEFTINGVNFEITDNMNMTEVISEINNSNAGVRVVYKPLEDVFVMESTSSGAGHEINISQTEGNLLNAMFGSGMDGLLSSGGTVSSAVIVKSEIAADVQLTDEQFTEVFEATFDITVDGEEYNLSIARKSDGSDYTKAEIIEALNEELDKEFDGNIKLDSAGNLQISDDSVVSFDKTKVDMSDSGLVEETAKTDLALAFGFSVAGSDNVAAENSTLAEIGLGSLTGSFGTIDSTATLAELETLSGGALKYVDGRIEFTASGENISLGSAETMQKLFGSDTVTLGVVGTGMTQSAFSAGQNAIVEIDGVITERSSNNFSVNGMNVELLEVHEAGEVAESISISRGTDEIVEGIKSFIEDYNTLIGELNNLIREETNYKEYAPLTTAEKAEMSEKEIELWEEKAKEGLLYNDSTISGFLTAMRESLYTMPEGSSMALYTIGIETSSNWQDYGKLVMTTDGEAQLRQAIENNPDEVINLFTDENDGIAVQMQNILDSTAKISSGSPGSLVQVAGYINTATDTDNDIYYRLQSLEEKIEALKLSYENEKERYWDQFNAMEAMVSEMNSQSSWLTQQLG